ncbi:MAG: Integral rane protein [Acidimicrobiaceae bacterium]|nr:Integral rane protein [Acidimicrobiaceae bacterium]
MAALGAAVLFAVSAVLQQRSARQAPDSESLRPELLVHLVRRRTWVAGVGAMLAAYVLETVALALGDVAVVEPLVATELVFAVPFAVRAQGKTPGRREWAGIVAVVAGVSGFLLGASPSGGTSEPAIDHWLLGMLPSAAAVAVLIFLAQGPATPRRAGLLAGASGVSFGLLSLVTKSAVGLVESGGLVALATSWQPELLCILGIGGFLIAQSAYQAAPLANSLPIIDATEPIVAVLLGATVLEEHISLRPGSLALEICGALAMVSGVFLLGRSPLVLAVYESERKHAETRTAPGTGRSICSGAAPGADETTALP